MACTPDGLDALRAWAALYRELRPLLDTGDVVRSDHPDPALVVGGVVVEDRSAAVVAVVQVASGRGVTPGLVTAPGLDPDRRYRVRVRPEAGLPETVQSRGARWFDAATEGGVEVSGRVLGQVGLPMLVLDVQQGFLIHLTS
jgi:alpha-galactosidase